MWVALTYDHRIVDGREAVGFIVRVKEYIEEPTRLLLKFEKRSIVSSFAHDRLMSAREPLLKRGLAFRGRLARQQVRNADVFRRSPASEFQRRDRSVAIRCALRVPCSSRGYQASGAAIVRPSDNSTDSVSSLTSTSTASASRVSTVEELIPILSSNCSRCSSTSLRMRSRTDQYISNISCRRARGGRSACRPAVHDEVQVSSGIWPTSRPRNYTTKLSFFANCDNSFALKWIRFAKKAFPFPARRKWRSAADGGHNGGTAARTHSQFSANNIQFLTGESGCMPRLLKNTS